MGIYRRLFWSTIVVLSSLVSPISITLAESVERSFLLNSDGNASFEVLLQEAHNLVQTSIEQQFAENPNITEVSITVLGENQGQVVPILRSRVTRSQWQHDSRVERWTKYFVTSSPKLLGFYNRSAPTAPQPTFIGAPRRTLLQNDPGYRDD